MTARALLLAFASTMILGGAARAQEAEPAQAPTVPPVVAVPEVWAPVPVDQDGRSAYGLFLAGRLATARGDASDGAIYLRQALLLAPEQTAIRDQAFAANLLGGDLGFAGRITPDGEGVPALVTEVGRLVTVVQALDRGDARGALATIDARPIERPHARAGRLLTPWLAAGAGDWTRALAPAPALGPDSTALFLHADRARLLEMRRRNEDAEVEWKAVTAVGLGRRLFALDYGAFLERRGRRDEAVALYDAVMAEGNVDGRFPLARARAASRGRPPAMGDLKQGAADALTAAALQAGADGQHEFAAVYLRLSQDLAPSDLTLVNLGDSLMQAGLEGAGRDAMAGVTGSDPALYASAQMAIGESLTREGQGEAAAEAFSRAVAAAPRAQDAALAFASSLNDQNRHAEALAVLEGPAFADGSSVDALTQRAVSLRALGREPEAEAALRVVLDAEPENAAALALLGGLWLDARRVEEGAALIARAAAAAPDDASVQGALGWSQFRQGDFDAAVTTLEAAVDARPADPVVSDHLGDAYWRVGREREARFMWRRALSLTPASALQARLERKLDVGLDATATGG